MAASKPSSSAGTSDRTSSIQPRIAGSIERCDTSTTNSPASAAGTGSVVSSQLDASGKPVGRAARRTWWFTVFIVISFSVQLGLSRAGRLPAGALGLPVGRGYPGVAGFGDALVV